MNYTENIKLGFIKRAQEYGLKPQQTEELFKLAIETFKERPMWQRPVSSTVGRAFSPLYSLMLSNEDFLKPGPKEKDLTNLEKHYSTEAKQQDKKDIELAMYPNAAHPIENLKRIWKRKGTSVPGKLVGSLLSPLTDGMASLMRADHYNPYAHSITSYANSPAIKLHELGHAEDFADAKYKTPYALGRAVPLANIPITLMQEAIANLKGGDKLNKYVKDNYKKDERDFQLNKGNASLTGSMASYIQGMIPGLNMLPPVAAPIASAISRVGGAKEWSQKE